MKCRQKPAEVEAEQWFLNRPVDGVTVHWHAGISWNATVDFSGREVQSVYEGDWIVADVKGKRFLVRKDDFEAMYEPVEDVA